MENEYQRGFREAIETSARRHCFLCRDFVTRVWRPEMAQFSHKLNGQSDPEFSHYEHCRSNGIWELLGANRG